MKKPIIIVLALISISIIFGTIYAGLQQSLRMSANDPQIQLARDGATAITSGATPASVVGGKIDIRKSLASFVVVYDKNGRVIVGNGYLEGHLPLIPLGVLTAADEKEYHTVTWQPASDVRIAAVSVKAGDYYVVSGRSLKEVEKREEAVMKTVSLGLLTTLVFICAWSFYYHQHLRERMTGAMKRKKAK